MNKVRYILESELGVEPEEKPAEIMIEIPNFFWNSWAAIVAVYAGGRSYEKAKKPSSGSNSDSEGVG